MPDSILPPSAPPSGSPREPDRSGFVVSVSRRGFHRVAYVEFGDPDAKRVAVCVHGLSRQGRDFDHLATALADQGWRVICPDLVGRGRSDWLKNPEEYNLPQYAMDLTVLIARLGVPAVDWIGTSLGGLIGIVMAGQPGTPIQRLIVNDIGPFLPWQALQQLARSVRTAPRTFTDLAQATAHYRKVLAPFGTLSEQEWQHLARHSLTQTPDGTLRKMADPEITAAFKPGWYFNLSLWTYWDAVTCPTLALRGVNSDLLLAETANEMRRRGPRAEVIEVAGCGHAPALMDPLQIRAITGWLAATKVPAA